MKFWKYFWLNSKWLVYFIAFMLIFTLASHLIYPLGSGEWLGMASGCFIILAITISGDYLHYKANNLDNK